MLEFRCPHCGKTLDLGEKYTATTEVCDGCGKSVWTPAMPPPPPPAGPGEDEYEQDTEANTPGEGAGFWRRPIALCIDVLTLYLVFRIFNLEIGPITSLHEGMTMFVVTWLYFAVAESSPKRATFGKWLLGLRVTDSSGRRISFGRATGRHFGKLLTILSEDDSFTNRKQMLHDTITDCLVIRE